MKKDIYVVRDGCDYVYDRGQGWTDKQAVADKYTYAEAVKAAAKQHREYPDAHIVRLVPKAYIVCAHGCYVYSEFSYCTDVRMAMRFTKKQAKKRATKEGPGARIEPVRRRP